jgi:hypothetical protein
MSWFNRYEMVKNVKIHVWYLLSMLYNNSKHKRKENDRGKGGGGGGGERERDITFMLC